MIRRATAVIYIIINNNVSFRSYCSPWAIWLPNSRSFSVRPGTFKRDTLW